jgi:cytochrome c biogenesis protein CcmG/thiol:disulfide interchange protein DsbE
MSAVISENTKKLMFFLVPLAIFLVLVGFLLSGLSSDPKIRESAAVDRILPQFALYDLMDDKKQWTQDDLVGEPFLLNIWGTWCITCDQELPFLTELRKQGVKIVGLYYDQEIDPDFGDSFDMRQLRVDVKDKLSRLGNPYQFNIFDNTRETLLDLGVTGAPETFLVDEKGVIRIHHHGDINPRVWKGKFADKYAELKAGSKSELEPKPKPESKAEGKL